MKNLPTASQEIVQYIECELVGIIIPPQAKPTHEELWHIINEKLIPQGAD